jgi:uncharacterized protein DUF4167
MRNGQNNKRMRNRNNNHNNNNNRRGQNPMTRVFESNGPDIKIRGTASHIAEKYLQLARDARSSGDPVAAENYYQHAEHYFRLIAAAQEQFRQSQPQHQQQQPPRPDEVMGEDAEDDGENFSSFGQEPGFVPQPQQQQPYMRDNGQQPREGQPFMRDQQPREHREHRSQPQYQPQAQPQPAPADSGSVDRLPSFITGPQPQINGGGGYEGNGGGDRFPRRRRRPHGGPRSEGMGPQAGPQGDDVNSGND